MKNIPGTQYISQTGKGYSIRRIIKGKQIYYGYGKTLIEALMIKDILESEGYRKPYNKPKNTSNVYPEYKGWIVKKVINKKIIRYGYFKTKEEAEKYRDFLNKKGWSTNYIKKPKQGTILKNKHNTYGVKYKQTYYGTFNTYEDAEEMRKLVVKYDGDWDRICECPDYNHYTYLNHVIV